MRSRAHHDTHINLITALTREQSSHSQANGQVDPPETGTKSDHHHPGDTPFTHHDNEAINPESLDPARLFDLPTLFSLFHLVSNPSWAARTATPSNQTLNLEIDSSD